MFLTAYVRFPQTLGNVEIYERLLVLLDHHGTAAGFLGLLGVDIPKTLDAKAAEEKILPFYNAICRDTAADETRRRTAHTHLKFSIATLGSKAEPRFRAKIARSKANLEGYTVKPKNFDFMMVEHMKLLYQAYCEFPLHRSVAVEV